MLYNLRRYLVIKLGGTMPRLAKFEDIKPEVKKSDIPDWKLQEQAADRKYDEEIARLSKLVDEELAKEATND